MRLLRAAAVLLVNAAAAQPISIQLNNGVFRVAGWTAPLAAPATGWLSVLAVYAGPGDLPPMLGSHAVENGSLVFRPRFPLAAGVRYRAVFHPPGGGVAVESMFSGPPRETTRSTRVDRVYPSGDVLPGNLLRIYVYFSAPMSRGEAGSRMRLLNANGQEVSGAFLPGEELWDPAFKRLTMTLDPGRIKRGLTSNQTMGPPIAEGRRYTLVIDSAWLDARGVPLVEGFRKPFRGGPAQRTPPDPKQWIVTAPKAATSGPLTVVFPASLNYVLLQRMLRVMKGSTAAAGAISNEGAISIEGAISVERQETVWKFTPRQRWSAGRYELVVDTAIEDLAGNHVGQPFDIDVFDRVTERIVNASVSLPFTVR